MGKGTIFSRPIRPSPTPLPRGISRKTDGNSTARPFEVMEVFTLVSQKTVALIALGPFLPSLLHIQVFADCCCDCDYDCYLLALIHQATQIRYSPALMADSACNPELLSTVMWLAGLCHVVNSRMTSGIQFFRSDV